MNTQQVEKKVFEDEKNVIFYVYEGGSSVNKLVYIKYPLTARYANRVEKIIEVSGDTVKMRVFHYSWDGDGPRRAISVKDPMLATEVRQRMEQVRNPEDFEKLYEYIEEKRYTKEDELMNEILKKLDELTELLKEDYNEILSPYNDITDTQVLDQQIDAFIKEIIRKLRNAGYSLPKDCANCHCELFGEGEEE